MMNEEIKTQLLRTYRSTWTVIKNLVDYDHLARVVWSNKTGQFIYVNEKFAEILGYNRYEVVGITFRDLLHEEDLRKADDEWQRNMESRGNMECPMLLRYRHRSGHYITLIWYSAWNDHELVIGSGQCDIYKP
jgi:PAS domain S-box-containing protein